MKHMENCLFMNGFKKEQNQLKQYQNWGKLILVVPPASKTIIKHGFKVTHNDIRLVGLLGNLKRAKNQPIVCLIFDYQRHCITNIMSGQDNCVDDQQTYFTNKINLENTRMAQLIARRLGDPATRAQTLPKANQYSSSTAQHVAKRLCYG